MFETRYATILVARSHSVTDAKDYCASDAAAPLNAAMTMATIGWTFDGCVAYVHDYITAELKASASAVAAAAAARVRTLESNSEE